MKTVIKGGRVVDPIDNKNGIYDLVIENEVIVAIHEAGTYRSNTSDKIIEAKGMLVLPGLIDLHVHLREPGYEWKETVSTGSQAAVLGGYTTICCMPNTKPVNDRAEITKYILEKASQVNLARVLPIGAVTTGLLGEQITPLAELKKAGCVAYSDDGEPVHNSGIMRKALEWAKHLDLTISCHEEDKCLSCKGSMHESELSLRLGIKGVPTVAEDVMVARDIELALYTGGRVHICHISSARGVELVRRAKKDGVPITCEVTPHHLLLDHSCLTDYDANYKMSPPLRTKEIQTALWEGLKDGTIDAIASDHAPHEIDSKKVEFDLASFGILGLQTSLPLMLESIEQGKISEMRAVSAMTCGPAKCFNLPMGNLRIGSKADISIIDPFHEWTLDTTTNVSKSINSPFWNRKLKGRAKHVLVNGRLVVKDFECNFN